MNIKFKKLPLSELALVFAVGLATASDANAQVGCNPNRDPDCRRELAGSVHMEVYKLGLYETVVVIGERLGPPGTGVLIQTGGSGSGSMGSAGEVLGPIDPIEDGEEEEKEPEEGKEECLEDVELESAVCRQRASLQQLRSYRSCELFSWIPWGLIGSPPVSSSCERKLQLRHDAEVASCNTAKLVNKGLCNLL